MRYSGDDANTHDNAYADIADAYAYIGSNAYTDADADTGAYADAYADDDDTHVRMQDDEIQG